MPQESADLVERADRGHDATQNLHDLPGRALEAVETVAAAEVFSGPSCEERSKCSAKRCCSIDRVPEIV